MTQDSSAPVCKLRVGTDYVYMCNLSPIGQNFQRGSDWNDLSRFLQHPLGPRLNKAARWKTPLVVRPPGSFHLIVSVDEQAALPPCQWPPKTRLVRFGSLWHGACSEWPFRFVLHLFVLPDSGGSIWCKMQGWQVHSWRFLCTILCFNYYSYENVRSLYLFLFMGFFPVHQGTW